MVKSIGCSFRGLRFLSQCPGGWLIDATVTLALGDLIPIPCSLLASPGYLHACGRHTNKKKSFFFKVVM